MEEGKIYEVYYFDDTERIRHKTLRFMKETNSFLIFNNDLNKKEEIIPISKISRIEGKNGKE